MKVPGKFHKLHSDANEYAKYEFYLVFEMFDLDGAQFQASQLHDQLWSELKGAPEWRLE